MKLGEGSGRQMEYVRNYEVYYERRQCMNHERNEIDYHGNDGRNQRHNVTYEGVKMKFPSFHGKNYLEAYLDWEFNIGQLFEARDTREERIVKFATSEFKEHALFWWYQNVKERMRCGTMQLDD